MAQSEFACSCSAHSLWIWSKIDLFCKKTRNHCPEIIYAILLEVTFWTLGFFTSNVAVFLSGRQKRDYLGSLQPWGSGSWSRHGGRGLWRLPQDAGRPQPSQGPWGDLFKRDFPYLVDGGDINVRRTTRLASWDNIGFFLLVYLFVVVFFHTTEAVWTTLLRSSLNGD